MNNKTIFWNVDTQYDFMRPDGKLYVKDAERIEDNLAKLTLFAERSGIKVVNTADWHYANSKELSEKPDFMNTFPPHCMAGTPGAEYVLATAPKDACTIDWRAESFDRRAVREAKNLILYKDAFDIFTGNKHADEVLATIDPARAVVYGVATNVCVDQAVRGLLARGKDVYVPIDGIKELPNLPLDTVFGGWKELADKNKVTFRLTTVDDIVNYKAMR